MLLKFRAAGSSTVLFTLTGYLQGGIEDESGNVTEQGVGETYAVPVVADALRSSLALATSTLPLASMKA